MGEMRVMKFLFCFLLFGGVLAANASAGEVTPGPSFSLVDQHGKAVTEASLKGKPTVLHFGFTHCPVICPTTLYEVAGRMRDLGPVAGDIRFVFATVDPERDTVDVLKTYIENFDERIIGLTGTLDNVTQLAKGLGASFAKRPRKDGGYDFDHTIFAYLLDRDWKKVGVLYIGPGTGGDAVVKKLRALANGTYRRQTGG
ncbi:MAG: SCO family protein [Methyloligellaceae bacterium]